MFEDLELEWYVKEELEDIEREHPGFLLKILLNN